MSDLFNLYEERPAQCQATPVHLGTINDIAAYYGYGGYKTKLERHQNKVTLVISHPETDHHPGFELTIQLPPPEGVERPQVLIYGRPPRLENADVFERGWQEVKR